MLLSDKRFPVLKNNYYVNKLNFKFFIKIKYHFLNEKNKNSYKKVV